MAVSVRPLTGVEIAAALDDLARLRIAVFADWPYLYDGDPACEAQYLAEYAASPDAVLVAALDGDRIVGAATAAPMMHQKAEFRAPFEARGLDVRSLFYFGESVLLPEYRGQGAGVRFFEMREAHARSLGLEAAAFCAVTRNENDPRRPKDYVPLDAFWRKRGYARRPDISVVFEWQEVGDERETPHSLGFWVKDPL